MKTKRFVTALAVLIIFFSAPLFARDRIVDKAGLLGGTEKAELEEMAELIASSYNFDLVIVTEKTIGGAEPADYADDFFDNNGYGSGEDRDGSLLLQVTGSRDYAFSHSGRGIKIMNSSAEDRLEADVVSFLGKNDPAGAYRAFIAAWEEFLVLDAKGRSYNFFHEWNTPLVVAAWIIAFIIGFLIVQSWKMKMNTALPQTQAAAYVVPGSLSFTRQSDRFLYSTVTKTKKQKPPSSSSGGIRTSSSGRSHSGRSGKY